MESLRLLCEVAHEHQLAEIDFISVAEMTLRLAMVLESLSDAPPQSGRKTGNTCHKHLRKSSSLSFISLMSFFVTNKVGSGESTPIGQPESTLYMVQCSSLQGCSAD